MKGRAVTPKQKRFHDHLCRHIGCAPCRFHHGEINTWCSIHHIDGRTKPDAHWMVLPLCASHHQNGSGPLPVDAVHPFTRRFERQYGGQFEQLARCIAFLEEMGIAYEGPKYLINR